MHQCLVEEVSSLSQMASSVHEGTDIYVCVSQPMGPWD